MNAIKAWLSGKKTYLVCVGAVIASVVAWSADELTLARMIEAIVAAVAAVTLRAGVAKSAPAPKK